MSKFKVGDRVRRKKTLLSEERFGVMGVIYTISAPGLSGQWDTIEGIRVLPDYFELAEDDAEITQEASPVRTRTVTEVVAGLYGHVIIGERDNEYLPLPIRLTHSTFTATELTAIIVTLTAVRDALEVQT